MLHQALPLLKAAFDRGINTVCKCPMLMPHADTDGISACYSGIRPMSTLMACLKH